MLKRTFIFLTIGLTVMACTESDEYASAVIACQPGTALGVIDNDLFSARQDPDNATHAAGYCVNTSELQESCVTLQGAPNTYACSKLGTGMLLCGSEEVAALTDDNNCGRCGNKCGEDASCFNGICQSNEKISDCVEFDSSRCSLNEMCRVQYRGTENAIAKCAFTDEYCLSNYTNGYFDLETWGCMESEVPPAKTCEEFDVNSCHSGEVCRVRNEGQENAIAVCAYSDAYCQDNYTNGYFDQSEWGCKQPKTCEDEHAPSCSGNEVCRVKTENNKTLAVCAPSDEYCASLKTNGYFDEENWSCSAPPIATTCEDEHAPTCGTGEVCRVKDEGTDQALAVCAPSDDYCAENYIRGIFNETIWDCISDTDGDGVYDPEDECPYNQLLNKKISGKDEYNECFRVANDGTFYIFHAKNLEELAHNASTTDDDHPFRSITQIVFKNDINMGDLDNTNATEEGCDVSNWDIADFNINGNYDYTTSAYHGITSIDGMNHKITSTHPKTGQRCSLSRSLFNVVTDCSIKNLSLDFDVIGSKAEGMLANKTNSNVYAHLNEFDNISYSGIVRNESPNIEYVGGLVGQSQQTKFKNCTTNGIVVEAPYGDNVGGLAGSASSDSAIVDSSFIINHVLGRKNVGGVVGYGQGMMNPTLATNVQVLFDVIERAENYIYDDAYIGGFSGTSHAAENVSVVGNKIIGRQSSVGGFVGFINGYGYRNIVVAIDTLEGTSVVSGFANMGHKYTNMISNILVDNGSVIGYNVNGFMKYKGNSGYVNVDMITSSLNELNGNDKSQVEVHGFAQCVFTYDSDAYSHSSSVEMGTISSVVNNIKYDSETRVYRYSGFLGGYIENSSSDYTMSIKNAVSLNNRPTNASTIYNDTLSPRSPFTYENIYYYNITDNDTAFSSVATVDSSIRVNESNASSVLGKLNTALDSLKANDQCKDCEWILKSFHNNTSNKDVNLPYLKQQGLEDKLAAQKTAHCEAFGAKSKFCP